MFFPYNNEICISLIPKSIKEEVRDSAGDLAADLVARLLHPNHNERIESMSKILQHKFFHKDALEGTDNSKEVKATERAKEVKGFRKRSTSRRR